jgi:acyl carrier protein
MTVTPTERDLHELIARVVRRDISPLTPETRIQDALGIDSLDVLRLLAAAEDRYGIRISDEDLVALRSYGDLQRLLGIGAEEPVS